MWKKKKLGSNIIFPIMLNLCGKISGWKNGGGDEYKFGASAPIPGDKELYTLLS